MRWFFYLAVLPLFGAYVGNPADPALMNSGFFSSTYPVFKFTSGYLYDYTQNKRFTAPDEIIKKFGLHSQMGNFSMIFMERLELFGSGGGSKEMVEEKEFYDVMFDVHTNYHFSWACGGKVVLVQWGQTFLGTDVTYFAIPSSHKSYFKYFNRLGLPIDPEKQEFSLKEWQANVGLSSRFYFLTPYAGFSYLNSKLRAEISYHNEVKWGYFYGLTLSLTGKFHLNFERRLRNEFAYSFSTTAVF